MVTNGMLSSQLGGRGAVETVFVRGASSNIFCIGPAFFVSLNLFVSHLPAFLVDSCSSGSDSCMNSNSLPRSSFIAVAEMRREAAVVQVWVVSSKSIMFSRGKRFPCPPEGFPVHRRNLRRQRGPGSHFEWVAVQGQWDQREDT